MKKTTNGKGVFTNKVIPPDSLIIEIKGKFIPGNIGDDVPLDVMLNSFRFDKNKYIDSTGSIGYFLNHSCKPNAKIVKRKNGLFLYSLETINKGEEIFFDYSTTIADDDIWEMECRCNCGSHECRGTIAGFDTLSKKVQKDYINKGMVPKFILGLSL
ncbi:MAG: SET domain-containing protein-lysine N-methyltransferase [Parcubacteria group bacterium]